MSPQTVYYVLKKKQSPSLRRYHVSADCSMVRHYPAAYEQVSSIPHGRTLCGRCPRR